MKKTMLNWLSIFVLAVVCVGFASCGDDDDDVIPGSGGSEVSTKSIVGEWYIVHVRGQRTSGGQTVNYDDNLYPPYHKIVVFPNGIGEFWEYGSDHTGQSDDRGNNYHEDGTFTWVKAGNSYVISSNDWNLIQMTAFDGNNMTIYMIEGNRKEYYTLKRVK